MLIILVFVFYEAFLTCFSDMGWRGQVDTTRPSVNHEPSMIQHLHPQHCLIWCGETHEGKLTDQSAKCRKGPKGRAYVKLDSSPNPRRVLLFSVPLPGNVSKISRNQHLQTFATIASEVGTHYYTACLLVGNGT